MTTLLDRSLRSASHPEAGGTTTGLPSGRHTRRPLMAVVSAAIVLASVAAFAAVYRSSSHPSSVLIVTTTIQQGQQITGSDLGQASADVSNGVSPIPVAAVGELAGKRAAVTIPAGSLLVTADISGSPPIGPGDAVVGLALKSGQLPSNGVEPGDQVMIVQTAAPGALPTGSSPAGTASSAFGTAGILVPEATVFDTAVPPLNSSSGATELVSVEVSATLGAAVSTDAAADQVSLVLLPPRSAGGQP